MLHRPLLWVHGRKQRGGGKLDAIQHYDIQVLVYGNCELSGLVNLGKCLSQSHPLNRWPVCVSYTEDIAMNILMCLHHSV